MRRIVRRRLLWLCLSGVLCVAFPAGTSAAGTRNGLIAFMSARGGGDAVWVMSADGSGQTRLTKTVRPAWDGYPAFSSPTDVGSPTRAGILSSV